MSKCGPNSEESKTYTTSVKKSTFKVPLTAVESIIKLIKMIMSMPDTPFPGLNKYMVNTANKFRQGMNPADITARTIGRMAEIDGRMVEPMPSGEENKFLKVLHANNEEIIRELTTRAKVTATVDFNALNIITKGSPYTQQGGNIDVGKIEGVIS